MEGKKWATLTEMQNNLLSLDVLHKHPSLPIFPIISCLRAKQMPLSGYCHFFLLLFCQCNVGVWRFLWQLLARSAVLGNSAAELLFFLSVLTFPHLAVGTPTPFLLLLLKPSPRGVIGGLNMCWNTERGSKAWPKQMRRAPGGTQSVAMRHGILWKFNS